MTRYDPDKHHRRSIRLGGHDYTRPGAYFVTICTYERECLLGEMHDGVMILNECGWIVERCWRGVPDHFPHVELDTFVVMPNHVHGIIVITDPANALVGAGSPRPGSKGAGTAPLRPSAETAPLRRPTLGQIVAYFKYQSTKRINQMRSTPGMPLWQRNYYEHVIRDEDELNQIRTYIAENPLKWELDENHPSRLAASDRLGI